MNEILQKIEKLETERAEIRKDLMGKELELEVASAEATLKSKEEWKELGISNAEGRKAQITLETADLKEEVNSLKCRLLSVEAELRVIEKKIELWKIYDIEQEAKQ